MSDQPTDWTEKDRRELIKQGVQLDTLMTMLAQKPDRSELSTHIVADHETRLRLIETEMNRFQGALKILMIFGPLVSSVIGATIATLLRHWIP